MSVDSEWGKIPWIILGNPGLDKVKPVLLLQAFNKLM